MKNNMGSTDKIIRLVIALVIAGLYFGGMIEGTLAYVLLAVAVIFTLTSVISFCPLYGIFKINSGKKD